jgi:hypothetical protein
MLLAILYGNGITLYKHTDGPVNWGPKDYISITDCSGFVNALLKQSYQLPLDWHPKMHSVKRMNALGYYQMINDGFFFNKINNIKNAKIGDFISFRILPGTSITKNSGHVMLINGLPIPIKSSEPYIKDTIQWIVNIIDQSGAHGPNDTRHLDNTTGLGSGYLRLYTNHQGILTGYTWSTQPISKYMDQNFRPIVIGRLKISD